jgi:UDP-GlcNAc3NAcA epimerase
MKILTVVGARPQFIKTGPISTELNQRNGCEEILVHTGQHYDANMSDVFFDELGLRQPDYRLAVGSASHG